MDTAYYNGLVEGSIVTNPSAADALMPYLGAIIAVAIVVAVLQIIAMWKIFTKAGEAGWKSIIPIYNLIVLYRISGLNPLLILLYLLVAVPVVGGILSIVLSILLAYKLSKSFDHGIGMTIVLLLLGPIGYLVIGFGSSQYVGSGENA